MTVFNKAYSIFLVIFLMGACFVVQAKAAQKSCEFKSCQFDRRTAPLQKALVLKFERVIDGDTFVASGRKIRVWGIDAPEKDETGYKVSGWFLESLLKGSELSCKFIYKDKYKRDVMHCFTNEADIGSEMVRFGLAKDFKKYSGGYYRPEEEAAKKALKGIWSVKNGK